jgi:Mg-chelatase subunit ChlD
MRALLGRSADGLADGAALARRGWRGRLPGQRGEGEVVRLPATIAGSRTLPVPLRAVVVIDESGSTASSDPQRDSHRATLLVCEWMAEHSQDEEDEIGVVRFAERASAIRPQPALYAETTLRRALARPANIGGGTILTPAIDKTCRLLRWAGGQRQVVFLLTDGAVSESADDLRTLFRKLRSRADAVYLLALDHDGSWKLTQSRYQSLGLTGQFPITQRGAGQLAMTLAEILADEAGLALYGS